MIDFKFLNNSAKAQLKPGDFTIYEEYRDNLIDENNPHAYEILTGHIWGMLEIYAEAELDDD